MSHHLFKLCNAICILVSGVEMSPIEQYFESIWDGVRLEIAELEGGEVGNVLRLESVYCWKHCECVYKRSGVHFVYRLKFDKSAKV